MKLRDLVMHNYKVIENKKITALKSSLRVIYVRNYAFV